MARQYRGDDQWDLSKFVKAQEGVYGAARAELAAGAKRSHWMWFVFPQVRGLGSSFMAQRFAIADEREAAAYLKHPKLGPRLRECAGLVNAVEGKSLAEVFGSPDDLKFHSSMTLFARAAERFGMEGNGVFREELAKWFGGVEDAGTVGVLGEK